jgi:hypothetical protein
MFKEEISLIPGFTMPALPRSGKLLIAPKTRFLKMGPNAEHPKTVQMREIKEKLRLTTVQLVAELNAYEKVHQSKNFRRSMDGSPAWHKVGSVLMSSYLQGWVMQEEFIALMTLRLKNLYKFKKDQGQLAPKSDIQTIMNRWYKTLGIDPSDSTTSPTRSLAKRIAPFYRRPVLATVSGKFKIDSVKGHQLICKIVTDEGETHQFGLDPVQPLEVTDGEKLKVGQVLQYAVLMQTTKQAGKDVLTHEPSINHTTFFRWYSQNKAPRSIKTLDLVQAAVDEAAKLGDTKG